MGPADFFFSSFVLNETCYLLSQNSSQVPHPYPQTPDALLSDDTQEVKCELQFIDGCKRGFVISVVRSPNRQNSILPDCVSSLNVHSASHTLKATHVTEDGLLVPLGSDRQSVEEGLAHFDKTQPRENLLYSIPFRVY